MKVETTAHITVHGTIEDAIGLASADTLKWNLLGYDVFERSKQNMYSNYTHRAKALVVAYYRSKDNTSTTSCIFEIAEWSC